MQQISERNSVAHLPSFRFSSLTSCRQAYNFYGLVAIYLAEADNWRCFSEMKSLLSFRPARLLLPFVAAVALSSCAPPPGGTPSVALREQLQEIRQQQKIQAEQMQLLQQHLSYIEKNLGIDPVTLKLPSLPVTPEAVAPEAPLPSPAIRQTPDASAYVAAFSHLASARYAAAESGFENFLRDYTDHRQAPNARYWLANAQYSQGKNELAAANFRQIIDDPRAQSKAPEALLQLARLYRQQGVITEAERLLDQLRNSYPDSPQAQQLKRSDTSSPNNDTILRQRGN